MGEPSASSGRERDWLRIGKRSRLAAAFGRIDTKLRVRARLERARADLRRLGEQSRARLAPLQARIAPRFGALTRAVPGVGARLGAKSWDFRRLQAGLRPRHLAWAAGAVGLLAVLSLCAFIAICMVTLPFRGGLAIEPTPSALLFESAGGELFATRGVIKGDRLKPDEISPKLKQAIVAIEDRRFYQHHGIDLRGITRALFRDLGAGGTREGGSTLTQQLVRMLYLSQERTLTRKVQEAVLALWLESQIGKDEIVTLYLDTAYFGAGVYGADAAAKRYFGKSATAITLSEAAMLAGLVRAPSQLAPHRNLDGARGRAEQVLAAMVETGAIKPEEVAEARRFPASLKVPPETPIGANYFVDTAASEVRNLVGSGATDLRVATTLDMNLQNAAESVVARHLAASGAKMNVSQVALVAMSPTGAVLAMVGGRDYGESQFNRVTQARRQPGSLFKLFDYLAAFEAGMSPDTVMVDRPVDIGGWQPENYEGHYRGPTSLRSAFAHSLNTVAVQVAMQVGIDRVIATARRLGITSDLPRVPSLALGAAAVTPLEITAAFAALDANAERVDPYLVRSVRNGDQTLYVRPQVALPPAANHAARRGMLDLLSAVVSEGTGRGARVPGPVAGKTGTTQDSRDAWFVGFTPDLVVGVWVGNDDNSPTKNVTGGGLPAAIWKDFVSQARTHKEKAPPATVQASGVPAGPASPLSTDADIRGVPRVIDTGTLDIGGRVVRLAGVEGRRGRAARELTSYIGGREVNCHVASGEQSATCQIEGRDLSKVVLFNGGGFAAQDATPELLAAEEQARSSRIGVWR